MFLKTLLLWGLSWRMGRDPQGNGETQNYIKTFLFLKNLNVYALGAGGWGWIPKGAPPRCRPAPLGSPPAEVLPLLGSRPCRPAGFRPCQVPAPLRCRPAWFRPAGVPSRRNPALVRVPPCPASVPPSTLRGTIGSHSAKSRRP